MNNRLWISAVCGFLVGLAAARPISAQMGRSGVAIGRSAANAAEEADYTAFRNEGYVDKRIELGEQFEKNYPKSPYSLAVDEALVFLYYNRGNWTKFYEAADRAVTENPNDMSVLRLAGWVIANNYNPSDPKAEANLSKAERYEKRVLTLVGAMKKSKTVTDGEFNEEKASDEWQAHSGLGMIYFRRKDYASSAKEYQLATDEESPQPNQDDLYILALNLQQLNRTNDAIDAFKKCAAEPDDRQQQCIYGAANPAEQTAYEMFRNEANVPAKIKLAENFDEQFAGSRYKEAVDSALVALYETQGQWDKFYALANDVLAKDPDNVGILTFVGWVIPRIYDADEPGAAAKLAESEQYEKRALELISTMKPTGQLSGDQFNLAKDDVSWQAHTGLGLTYFRRNDYADSARELQTALKEPSSSDSLNFYVFGIDLRKLNRNTEAADAFEKCAAIPGILRSQCSRDAMAARNGAAVPAAEPAPIPDTVPNDSAAGDSKTTPTATGSGRPPNPEATSTSVAPDSSSKQPAETSIELAFESATPPAGTTLVASSGVAPSAPPAPVPPEPDIPRSTAPESAPTIKAETISIPVRVVVRDNNGHAVANLKKEDFKIYQDGKLQTIANFTAIVNRTPAASASVKELTPKSVRSVANDTSSGGSSSDAPIAAAPAPARFIALFFDDVHLYFADSAFARGAAQKYINNLPPEARVGIITASGQNESEFTSDRDKLGAALKNLVPHPFTGGSINPTDANCPPPMTYTEAEAIDVHGSNPVTDMAGADFAQCLHMRSHDAGVAVARSQAAQTHIAAEEAEGAVLDTLQRTVRRLAMFPGQRSIVMVTPGFMYGDHASQFADITNLALRYNVVINTLDAKAIWVGEGKWDPDRFKLYGYGHMQESEVMADLAAGTGGLFIRFNNDLLGSMREMSEPPEAYYMLAYAPENLAADGKFHNLKVSLSGGWRYTLQARKGFYAPSHLETAEEAATRSIDDAVFSEDEQHDLPVKMQTSLARTDAGTKINLVANLDVANLRFVKNAGTNNEQVTLVASLFDSDGNYISGTKKLVTMAFDDDTLAKTQATGATVDFDFDVKAGRYMVRLVARDSNDEHITAENAPVTVPN